MSIRTIIGASVFVIALVGFSWLHGEQKNAKLSVDDYIEIQKLYTEYVYALDQGQGERFATTFVDDGEFVGSRGPGAAPRPPLKGKETLASLGSLGAGSRHFVSNLAITRTPDGAMGSCYLLQLNVKSTPAIITQTAIYEDTLVKTPHGWRFKKRIVWNDADDTSPFNSKLTQGQGSAAQ